MKHSVKLGDKLIAKDVCLMDTGEEALVKGGIYKVTRVNQDGDVFCIKSELYEVHEFDISSLDKDSKDYFFDSVEWTRPTHEEEYVGTDKRYTEEKEDQAFEELEKKLNSTRPNVSHYLQGQIEPIDFINSHGFNFNLGNAIKYITRCNHKGTKKEDLQKAIDYINFELERDK